MTPEAKLEMLSLGELAWPVSWLFRIYTPWGQTTQQLHADVPQLVGEPEFSRKLGLRLWSASLAVASTSSCSLLTWETVCWKESPVPFAMVAQGATGLQPGPGTGRQHSAQLVLHTGHLDSYARRKIPLPSIPRAWTVDGAIAPAGWSPLLTVVEGLNIGLGSALATRPYRWLLAYPEAIPAHVGNGNGVAFREVKGVRLCQYLDRAPEPSEYPFP